MDLLTKFFDLFVTIYQKIGSFLAGFLKNIGNTNQIFDNAQNIVNLIVKWLSENIFAYIKPIFFYLTNFLIQAFDFIFNFIKNLVGKL